MFQNSEAHTSFQKVPKHSSEHFPDSLRVSFHKIDMFHKRGAKHGFEDVHSVVVKILNGRENVPNKAERKAIRKQKQKEKQNR